MTDHEETRPHPTTYNGKCYSKHIGGEALHRTRPMANTISFTANEQALQAINTLRSLPSWDKIADAYGEIGVSLDDLANDLEKYNLSEIIRLIDQNRADATAEQEHIYRIKG
jgi:hypothetical protein